MINVHIKKVPSLFLRLGTFQSFTFGIALYGTKSRWMLIIIIFKGFLIKSSFTFMSGFGVSVNQVANYCFLKIVLLPTAFAFIVLNTTVCSNWFLLIHRIFPVSTNLLPS